MVYVAVGNASPDFDGTKRGGNNLFTSSIVALDLKTGAYKWHFQEVHHDIWDYDNACAPVLADIKFHGHVRKILMHAGKTGLLYIYDRTNGKPLVGIGEKAVPQEPRTKTSPTQPIPVGDSFTPTCPEPGSVAAGEKSSCIFGAYWDKPVVMATGTQGGNSWSPMSFDPKTGLLYVPGTILNSAFTLRLQEWDTQANRFQTIGHVAILSGGSPYQISPHGDNLRTLRVGGALGPAPAPPAPSLTQPAAATWRPRGGGR